MKNYVQLCGKAVILEIYPCIIDMLGKLLCKLYILTCDFSFFSFVMLMPVVKQTAAY